MGADAGLTSIAIGAAVVTAALYVIKYVRKAFKGRKE
jgi:hypothetical protein